MRLEMSEAAAAELRDVLDEVMGDLRMEISHTDRQDYREVLKLRHQYLDEIRRQVDLQLEGSQAYV